MLKKDSYNLVWIDLEMSGLDVKKETILEIAVIITDKELNNSIEGPNIVIYQPTKILDSMGTWCKNQHAVSGLTESVKNSTTSLTEAEKETLKFIKRYTIEGQNILCGNSIGHDQKFLEKYMPNIISHLHYRILDVSSIKETVRRWYNPGTYTVNFNKKNTHRALSDIKESIEELKFFRQHFFKKS